MTEDKINELPAYQITESILDNGLTVSIFDLNLEQLVFEKMYILFEKYQPTQKQLDSVKVDMQLEKDKLLMETDFKEVLNDNRPTVAMKEAYMKPYLAKFEDEIDKLDYQVQFYKNKLAIINDLIKAKRLMLEIENSSLE